MDEMDLNQIFTLYPACIINGTKFRAILNDLYPDCSKAVVNILVSMADCGICEEICSANQITALDKSRWQKRLENDYGFSENMIHRCFDLFGQNDTYSTSVVGVTYDGRQQVIHKLVCAYRLGQGTRLLLEPEPQNKYDKYAIKVLTINREDLGYISKEINKDICLNIKRGKTYSVIVTSVVYNYDYGIKIDIAMNGNSNKKRKYQSIMDIDIKVGTKLWHNFYGIGRVINVKIENREKYLTVLFRDVEKTFVGSLTMGKHMFTLDNIPEIEDVQKQKISLDAYKATIKQTKWCETDNDEDDYGRINYGSDVFEDGRVVHFDDVKDNAYDELKNSGNTTKHYEVYDESSDLGLIDDMDYDDSNDFGFLDDFDYDE